MQCLVSDTVMSTSHYCVYGTWSSSTNSLSK